ncbi:MAG TPA: hypothetical protein VK616_04115, partial [Flavitalea sp.]|nr:hypothetical protein [Flavitalea sp.]
KIITITIGGDTYNITYDSEGKVSQAAITPDNLIVQFQYSGNTVILNYTQNGTFQRKTIVTKNEQGFAANVRAEMNQAGTKWSNEAMQYEGTKLVKVVNTFSGNSPTLTAEYEWKNDNMVRTVFGNIIIDHEYDLTRPSQIGEINYLKKLLLGAKIHNNKNLLKSTVNDGDITNFIYIFDTSGRITTVSEVTSNSTLVYAHEYLCN